MRASCCLITATVVTACFVSSQQVDITNGLSPSERWIGRLPRGWIGMSRRHRLRQLPHTHNAASRPLGGTSRGEGASASAVGRSGLRHRSMVSTAPFNSMPRVFAATSRAS